MDYKEWFKGKKVTLLGLGLLGRGVNDAKFLAECGCDLIVTDLKNEEELAQSLRKISKFSSIKYSLGGHKLDDFKNRDFILKAAGVPLDSEYLKEARKNKIPIEMDESLFAKLAPQITIVGVTGTRGKTTIATLIYEILLEAKKKLKWNKNIFLAGNIKGVATLPLLSKVKRGDIVVMELSSWQLQGFGESRISPHVSVFTNFLADHMNYYKNSKELYWNDKAYIFVNQKAEDILVASKEVADSIKRRYGFAFKSKLFVLEEMSIPDYWEISIKGRHNLDNIKFAVAVADSLQIPRDIAAKVVSLFKGVEGRLELIKTKKGVEIYNDTTSTTPDSVVAALTALGDEKKKNIVLIIGGFDKGLPMKSMIEAIPKFAKAAVLLDGTGTDRIRGDIQSLPIMTENADTLSKAVKCALNLADKGDIVLFSPGFASFGMFKNEFDRGDKFVDLIKKI